MPVSFPIAAGRRMRPPESVAEDAVTIDPHVHLRRKERKERIMTSMTEAQREPDPSASVRIGPVPSIRPGKEMWTHADSSGFYFGSVSGDDDDDDDEYSTWTLVCGGVPFDTFRTRTGARGR
jgi:hypothetical protein